MLHRHIVDILDASLGRWPVVVLTGPRRCGKSTIAEILRRRRGGVSLNLATVMGRLKAKDLEGVSESVRGRLVVVEGVHRWEGLFGAVRQEVEQERRNGRFLLVGDAGVGLLRQDVGALLGMAESVEMGPLMASEVEDVERLWVRGGQPDSFEAESDFKSLELRKEHVRRYLEEDAKELKERVNRDRLDRVWMALAHCHGSRLEPERWVESMKVTMPTVRSYAAMLEELLLVRGLPGRDEHGNRMKGGRRWYVRDSGMLHGTLGIGDMEVLSWHPLRWKSWEGFVIENLLAGC